MSNSFYISRGIVVDTAGLEKSAIKFPIKIMLSNIPDWVDKIFNIRGHDVLDDLKYFSENVGITGLNSINEQDFNLLAHSLAKGQRYLEELSKEERDKYIKKIGFNPFFYDCTGEVSGDVEWDMVPITNLPL